MLTEEKKCKKEWDVPNRVWELDETSELMRSGNYADRFLAEYLQTKIRYERLRRFIAKLHACIEKQVTFEEKLGFTPDCTLGILEQQAGAMDGYLKILELRAAIEDIPLPPYRLVPAI